jgi:hypothetical protein
MTCDIAVIWAAVVTALMLRFLRVNYLLFNSLTEEFLHCWKLPTSKAKQKCSISLMLFTVHLPSLIIHRSCCILQHLKSVVSLTAQWSGNIWTDSSLLPPYLRDLCVHYLTMKAGHLWHPKIINIFRADNYESSNYKYKLQFMSLCHIDFPCLTQHNANNIMLLIMVQEWN